MVIVGFLVGQAILVSVAIVAKTQELQVIQELVDSVDILRLPGAQEHQVTVE